MLRSASSGWLLHEPRLMRPWRISGARAPMCDAAEAASPGAADTAAQGLRKRGCGAIGYRASGSVGPDWSGLRSAACGATAAALTRPKSAPQSRGLFMPVRGCAAPPHSP